MSWVHDAHDDNHKKIKLHQRMCRTRGSFTQLVKSFCLHQILILATYLQHFKREDRNWGYLQCWPDPGLSPWLDPCLGLGLDLDLDLKIQPSGSSKRWNQTRNWIWPGSDGLPKIRIWPGKWRGLDLAFDPEVLVLSLFCQIQI